MPSRDAITGVSRGLSDGLPASPQLNALQVSGIDLVLRLLEHLAHCQAEDTKAINGVAGHQVARPGGLKPAAGKNKSSGGVASCCAREPPGLQGPAVPGIVTLFGTVFMFSSFGRQLSAARL